MHGGLRTISESHKNLSQLGGVVNTHAQIKTVSWIKISVSCIMTNCTTDHDAGDQAVITSLCVHSRNTRLLASHMFLLCCLCRYIIVS